MSTSWGVTPQGFVLKQLADIKADLEAGFQAVFGAGINLTAQSRFGQVIGIFAERFAEVWELGEAIHNARNPDAATGASLDEVMALTGAQRLPPERSSVTGTATGTAGTVVPQGSVISVQGTGVRFRTTLDATIKAGGTDIACESADYGPFLAPAGLLTKIETPVAGWGAFANARDAIPGRGPEDDTDARLRREQLLRAEGNAAVEAVRSRVLRVQDVTACIVFENVTEAVGAYGLPPKSIEVLVLGGNDDALRQAIWQSKPGGIETFGGVTGTVVGSDGLSHPIAFSRPIERDVFLAVTVTRDPNLFPADGILQIKERLVEYAQGRLVDGSGFPGSAKWIQDDGTYPHLFRINGVVGTVGWYQHSGGSAGAAFDDSAWEPLAGIDATIEGAPTDLTHKKYVDAQDGSVLAQAQNFASGNMAPAMLVFGAQQMPSGAGTLALPPGFLAGAVSAAAGPEMPMPFGGKVTSLYVSNLYNIGGGFQPKCEVFKNFAPTGLACVMGGSGSGSPQYHQSHDTSHPFTFNPGDVIQVYVTLPAGMTTPPSQVVATLGITRA